MCVVPAHLHVVGLCRFSNGNGWLTSQWISTCHRFLPVSLITVLSFAKALPCYYPLSWNLPLQITLCETSFPSYSCVDNKSCSQTQNLLAGLMITEQTVNVIGWFISQNYLDYCLKANFGGEERAVGWPNDSVWGKLLRSTVKTPLGLCLGLPLFILPIQPDQVVPPPVSEVLQRGSISVRFFKE